MSENNLIQYWIPNINKMLTCLKVKAKAKQVNKHNALRSTQTEWTPLRPRPRDRQKAI